MADPGPGEAAGAEPRLAPFRVGACLVEPAWNRIVRDGHAVKLEPRVMRLLTVLAAAPARPLQRQQLLDSVWPEVTVNEEALSRAVSQLRRALGDDPRAPRYVETVHKGGYCLIAPVEAAEAADAPAAKAARPRRRWAWALIAVLAIALAAVSIYRAAAPSSDAAPALRPLVPLTSDPGREIDPAVSPDGTRVAYLASVDGGYDLFVRDVEDGAPLRLTRNKLAKGHPAWSPDGRRIALVAADGEAAAIYLIRVQDGAATKLIDLPSWSWGLDWSPDGRTLACSDAGPGEAPGIALVDIATRAVRPIARSGTSAGDLKPVFSPDGRRLAFLREGPLDRQRIGIVELARPEEPRLLDVPPQSLRGLDWAPDGEALIFSARSGRRFGLHRVAVAPVARPEALAAEGGDLFNPSIARTGRIVVEEVEEDRDVWRVDLAEGTAAALIRSTSDDQHPAYGPRGDALAFVSERSGHPELWVQSSGSEARRLTKLGGPRISHVSWSPDGGRLAFLAADAGGGTIHLAEAASGRTRALARGQGSVPLGWSADGRSLFQLAPTGLHWRLEALSLSGETATPIPAPPLRLAAVAADGRSVFALPAGENRLLHILPASGVVRQFRLPPSLPAVRIAAMVAAPGALHLVEDARGAGIVHRLELRSGSVARSVRIDFYGGGPVSLAPDGRWLAYTHARETANDLAWTKL